MALAMRFSRLLVLVVLCFITPAAQALDITTTDGVTYKQCSITRVEPDALRILHGDGAARIPYEKLPVAIQKQYFDSAKVMAYRQQAEAARQSAAAKLEEERLRQEKLADLRRQWEADQHREEEKQRLAAEKLKADQLAAEQRRDTERVAEEQRKATALAIGTIILTCLGIAFGVYIYFIPSIVGRHKANAGAIFVLNFFLGWSLVGWVVALVWACTKELPQNNH